MLRKISGRREQGSRTQTTPRVQLIDKRRNIPSEGIVLIDAMIDAHTRDAIHCQTYLTLFEGLVIQGPRVPDLGSFRC